MGVDRHVAALFENELYDLLPQTRGGYGRLKDFGVRFGYERVVVYPAVARRPVAACRPTPPAAACCSTTNRWHGPRWGEQLAAAMPSAILRLQARIANADGNPRRQAIHGRLAAHLPLYQLGRYRPPRTPGPISSEPRTRRQRCASRRRR